MSETKTDLPPDAGSTMNFLRTMQQHHVQLSAMADQKASILMGSAAVIMTIVLREVQKGEPVYPLLVVGFASFSAALLSILAIIPATGRQRSVDPNLMFFGHFADLDEAAFQSSMSAAMTDTASMHRTMLRDIHQLGTVLHRKKYRLIGWAYRVFLAGLIVGFGLFLVRSIVMPLLS